MNKILQLIRPFREARNIVALCLAFFLCAGSLWAQTDYSTTYTSGVTLSTGGGTNASPCKVIINSVEYDGLKAGTGSAAGAVKITVPENTKYFHIHVAGWNGKNVTMSVTSTGYSENIALTSNTGIANNSPFTFNGDASTSDYYKVITFPEALSEDTEFTFTALSGNRFVIWGVNAEEENLNAPSINASDVELTYDATSGQIEYTLNNPTNDGVLAASTNVDWIGNVTISTVSSILTFTTTANNYVSQRQGTVTLTYTYGNNQTIMKNVTVIQAGNPNAPGTENNPYTVAQARAAIDANSGVTGVYATGIVSAIPSAWSTQYSNITFNFVDEAGGEEFLQAYRCASSATADASTVQVGDVVLVYGNLTKYGSTYEFGQGCALVSLTHSAGFVAAPTFSPAAGTYTEPQTVTLSCATEGATIYYTLDGSEPDDESLVYTAPIYISSNTTINAIAYLDGNASTVATATYAFNSNAYTTIPELFAAATSTEQPVLVTFDSWIVSGVSTNGKNVYVTDGTNGFVIYSNTDMSETYAAGDVLDGEAVACTLKLYNGFAELLNVDAEDLTIISGATELSPAEIAMADLAGVNTGALVHYENLTCSVNNNKYYLSDGTTTIQVYNSLYAFGSALVADHIYNITGVYQQFNSTKEVLPRSAADIEEAVGTSIVVTPAEVNVPYSGAEGVLTLTANNVELDLGVEILWYDAEGSLVTGGYDWVSAEISADMDQVEYVVEANNGEARVAYMKVSGFDAELNEVLSDFVIFNQAEYEIDYATLPFAFDGGRADIANTVGLTHYNLDSDYASSPKLKFKNEGSWVILHFDGVPGQLSYTIKGNSFSGGTFTVQTSEDGVTYNDLETYTEFGNAGNASVEEVIPTMGENVRYIKWIYTHKATGNVGLGNIVLEEISTEPNIYVDEAMIEVGHEGGNGNITVTYLNMDNPLAEVAFYDEDGESTVYDWISAEIDDNNNVYYLVESNEGEARTAFMKVRALVSGSSYVYSNLITITQAAAPQQYELTISEFENLEMFTFVDDLNDLALEGAGTIMVTEGVSVSISVSANEGYVLSSLVVDGQSVLSLLDETGLYTFEMPGHNVIVTASAIEDVPGDWVLTSIEDLTENDIFVIVETKDGESHAMANDNGSQNPPAAVVVNVVGNTLSGEVPVNIQWNISVSDTGFIFYPNGNAESWLYCNNTNNGVRVGTGANKLFIMDTTGYMVNTGTGRYIGVYLDNPDWRCYLTINNNIMDQTFAFYKKVSATNTSQIALAAGTNWVSFNVETNLDELKAALVATGNTAITIQGQTKNTSYNGRRWNGQLNSLDLSQMYKIKVANACEITLEGMLVDPSVYSVNIALGVNYIAYPFTTPMTVANAFAGFNATSGDQVKSQLQNANYNGTRWTGQLRNLEPGQGYIYKSVSTETRPFTFPSGN